MAVVKKKIYWEAMTTSEGYTYAQVIKETLNTLSIKKVDKISFEGKDGGHGIPSVIKTEINESTGQVTLTMNVPSNGFRYGPGGSPHYNTANWEVIFEYNTNIDPVISLATTESRTLYENDTYNLTGTFNDADSGNVLSVKYSINNGEIRALTSAISDGIAKTFNRVLTYKNNKLYDGTTVITSNLAEGAQHVVKVWAEDDKGGKSQEQLRIFYVVANRAPLLTVNAFPATPNLLNTGFVKFGGTVSDPDGNAVKVEYKIRNGSFVEVYNGNGGSFEITVPLSSLNAGTNAISIRAVDSYGATTTRNLSVAKNGSSVPLKAGDKRYRVTPPNGSAQGVLLWVQRESGDLVVSAEISMTAAGEAENFVPMTLNSTAFVNGSIEEDEFFFEGTEAKTNIVVRLKMTRTNPASTAGIILVNGVLS